MEKTIEIYEVPKCPSCGKNHKYTIAVFRSSVLFGTSGSNAPVAKRLHKVFICPEKGTKFEGVVILQDDPKNRIASVSVEGLLEEKK